MRKRYEVVLTEQEKEKLEGWVKNPPRPYLRERARAILKVSQGEPIQATAEKLGVRSTAMPCQSGSNVSCQTDWKA